MDQKWENLTQEMSVVLVKMEPSDMLNLVQESSHCRCCFKTIEFYESQHPADDENLEKFQNLLNMALEPSQLAASFCGSCFSEIFKFSKFQEVASSRQKMFLENGNFYEIQRLKTKNEDTKIEIKAEPLELLEFDEIDDTTLWLQGEDEESFVPELENLKKERNSKRPNAPRCQHCQIQPYNMEQHLLRCIKYRRFNKLKIPKGPKAVKTKCPHCHYKAVSKKRLRKHIKQHLQDPIRKCSHCDFKCYAKMQFYKHLKEAHSDVINNARPAPVVCSTCGLNFKNLSGLNCHVQRIHEKVKNLECDACGRKFFSKSDFKTHWCNAHATEKIACEVCGKCFGNVKELDKHSRRIHRNAGEARCNYCEKVFTNPHYRDLHVGRMHERGKRFKCETCGKDFFRKEELKCHELKHKGIKFKCYVEGCPSAVTRKSVLIFHMKHNHNLSSQEQQEYMKKLNAFAKKINVHR